jgi:tetratricopeptide (TPR) repeat protein
MAEIAPPSIEAKEQLALGRQLLASGSCARARKHFLKAIQMCPEDAQLYLALGQSFFFQKKPDLAEAIRAFHRVVDLSPDWGEGHNWLGTAQEKQGKLSEAVASLERAISLAPEDTRPRIMLGVCLTRLKDYAAAITHLRQGIALKPHYAEASAHLFLADALRQSGQIDAAREEWRLIFDMPSEYPDYENPRKEARRLLKKYGS